MHWSQKQLNNLLLGFLLIVYERLEDSNNKNKDLKAKIYHLALKKLYLNISNLLNICNIGIK